MSIPRFFCPFALAPGQTFELPDELAHYALRVLRLKPGSELVLFDGRGGQYPARLEVEGKKALATLGDHQDVEAELPGAITLVQGLPAGDKMDWIIEKAVELGAARVVPIAAQRSVLQLRGERLSRRRQHWARVAQSASEQCGRNRIMAVEAPQSLADYLAGAGLAGQALLLCHPEADQSLDAALAGDERAVCLLVGPEGGWSEPELDAAFRHAATPVRFGRRVLRTETAGLALIAAVTALKGWS